MNTVVGQPAQVRLDLARAASWVKHSCGNTERPICIAMADCERALMANCGWSGQRGGSGQLLSVTVARLDRSSGSRSVGSARFGSGSAGQGLDLPDWSAATPDRLAGDQGWDTAEKGGQPDLGFHASKRSPQAVMGSGRKREVAPRLAGNIEPVRIGENAGVMVCGRV